MYRYFLVYIIVSSVIIPSGYAQVVLTDSIKHLNEVIITKEKQALNSQSGAATLSRADIMIIPSLMGSNDPLKALQTLPGIINGGDGNAGLYVRGGDPGQTQILYNGVTVYNPNHLFGLYSVFNPNYVGSISLHKSAPPAWYGGRLSSFVEIESDNRKKDSLKFYVDAGLLLNNIGLKTPVGSKTTVDLHTRKSYMNYTIWPLVAGMLKKGDGFQKIRYDFYDLNIGIQHQLNARNTLSLSIYNGKDQLALHLSDSGNHHYMQWGNTLATLKWQHQTKKQILLSSNLYYTGYKFKFGVELGDITTRIFNKVETRGWENRISKRVRNHYFQGGVHLKWHKIAPYNASSNFGGQSGDEGDLLLQEAHEANIFLNDAVSISQKWFANIGMRYTAYQYKGTQAKDIYRQQFHFFEPSVSLRYSLSDNWFLRWGGNISYQALQLIPVSTNALPIDFWISSGNRSRPAIAKQVSMGVYKTLARGYEAYVDVFYKQMNRLMEYSGYFAAGIDNGDIADQFYYGKGRSYGLELMVKKTSGLVTGSLSYTFSTSTRSFRDIDAGKTFPFKYDRPNQLVLLAHCPVSARWSLSTMFTYSDGSTYTPEIARYMVADNIITEYGDYNSNRIDAYHRLDLSATYKLKPWGRFQQELDFSIFNLYNHKNTLYNYYKYTGRLSGSNPSIKSELRNMAVLPIIPSVVYKIRL